MGNSNAHDHIALPVFLAGAGAGRYAGDRHIVTPAHTPLANFFMTLAEKEGVHLPSFGDSTGLMEV